MVGNLSTCRVVCHTRFTIYGVVGNLATWMSCVPQVHEVVGNLATCRVVCPTNLWSRWEFDDLSCRVSLVFNDDQDDGCYFQKHSNVQSHACIIYDNHMRTSYMTITYVYHI